MNFETAIEVFVLCFGFLWNVVPKMPLLVSFHKRRNLRMACTPRKRKEKFSPLELEILVAEVTKNHSKLYGSERVNLSQPARERIWLEISKKINTVARSPRTTRDLRRRWDDMKRRTKEKLALIKRSVVTGSVSRSPSGMHNDTNSDVYPGYGNDDDEDDHDDVDVDIDAPHIALELQSGNSGRKGWKSSGLEVVAMVQFLL